MRLRKASISVILVLSLLVLIGLVGCSKNVIIHPIEDRDIVDMRAGTTYTSEKDGWFVSDYYVDKVMEAKVD